MVDHIVKKWNLDSPVYSYVWYFDTTQGCHICVFNFCHKYEGPGEILKYLYKTKQQLKELFYKNENDMTLENFIRKFHGIYH